MDMVLTDSIGPAMTFGLIAADALAKMSRAADGRSAHAPAREFARETL